jgi:hypothetical protein
MITLRCKEQASLGKSKDNSNVKCINASTYLRLWDCLGDRLSPSNDLKHSKESTQGAMVLPDRGGAHVPVTLRGGL